LVLTAHAMFLITWQHLVALAQASVTVVEQSQLPTDVPDIEDLHYRRTAFKKLLAKEKFQPTVSSQHPAVSKGAFWFGTNWPLQWCSAKHWWTVACSLSSTARRPDTPTSWPTGAPSP
jgi:hypothetical protein